MNNGENSRGNISGSPGYNRSRLIRLTYDYARSPLSQDNFLRAFFGSLELSMDGEEDLNEPIRSKFFGFADYLVNNFFLPRKFYYPPGLHCFDVTPVISMPLTN